jgi:hypothetical protein
MTEEMTSMETAGPEMDAAVPEIPQVETPVIGESMALETDEL